MVRSALQMTTGGVFLCFLAFAVGDAHRILPPSNNGPLPTWICFLYLIAASILAFTAYTWLLEPRTPPAASPATPTSTHWSP